MHRGEHHAPKRVFPRFGEKRDRSRDRHGLAVAYVRHGVQYHWRSWDSWGDFFGAWLVHTMGVALLIGVALAAIIYSHKFFLGYSKESWPRADLLYRYDDIGGGNRDSDGGALASLR
jgi:hypothetical protein